MHRGYTQAYFDTIDDGSRASASVVVPLVMDLLRPGSVVDFGCGLGQWIHAFKIAGVTELVGVDGPHVNKDDLVIPREIFMAADVMSPVDLGREFDLAVSLEVAEHLPESVASQFVATLTGHAPVVLFSAAIPGQGGEHHVNEQWPSYWAAHFSRQGYKAFDILRPRLWNDSRVEWWYVQNVILFATGKPFERLFEQGYSAIQPEALLPLVHPENYKRQLWEKRTLSTCMDLLACVPEGSSLIFVDDNLCGSFKLSGRTMHPFIEVNGGYGGPPADDATAINELSRQIAADAQYIAFAWPAFWYLEHYAELAEYLHTQFTPILQNDNVRVYRLNTD